MEMYDDGTCAWCVCRLLYHYVFVSDHLSSLCYKLSTINPNFLFNSFCFFDFWFFFSFVDWFLLTNNYIWVTSCLVYRLDFWRWSALEPYSLHSRSFDDIDRNRHLHVHRIHHGWTNSCGFAEHGDVWQFRKLFSRDLRVRPVYVNR